MNGPSHDGESTDRYSGGTESYSVRKEEPSSPPEETPAPEETQHRRPFWKPLGFDTFDDYMRYLNRLQTLYEPLPRETPIPTPEGLETPDDTVAELDARPRPELRRRQVNVKLRQAEGEALDRAAGIYGLAPATLARVLVNQGVSLILEKY